MDEGLFVIGKKGAILPPEADSINDHANDVPVCENVMYRYHFWTHAWSCLKLPDSPGSSLGALLTSYGKELIMYSKLSEQPFTAAAHSDIAQAWHIQQRLLANISMLYRASAQPYPVQ